MTHANAPLTPAGRLRLVLRCEHRPIAHVAAEAGVSRQCLSKWKARYDDLGEAGLVDRASVPHRTRPRSRPTWSSRSRRGGARTSGPPGRSTSS